MPRLVRRLALPLLVLVLAPASAAGQTPGDEQYTDPFAEEERTQQQPPVVEEELDAPDLSSSPPVQLEGPVSGQGAQGPAAAAPAPAPAAPAPSAPAAAQLPATGSEPVVTLLLGGALVLGGAGLRLRAQPGA